MKLKNSLLSAAFVLSPLILLSNCKENGIVKKTGTSAPTISTAVAAKRDTMVDAPKTYPPLNKPLYDSLMKKLAHGDTTGRWPVKGAPYPLPGAILPFKRVVAYYGNLYSKKMGILGELPPNEMLARLHQEVLNWQRADPGTACIALYCCSSQRRPGQG
jgi:hypothetical protein